LIGHKADYLKITVTIRCFWSSMSLMHFTNWVPALFCQLLKPKVLTQTISAGRFRPGPDPSPKGEGIADPLRGTLKDYFGAAQLLA
jgi:hypothetical protein